MREFFKKELQKLVSIFIEEDKRKIEILPEDVNSDKLRGQYDYIILNSSLGDLPDIQLFFRKLRVNCSAGTRIMVIQYNPLWKPLVRFLEFLHLKTKGDSITWPSVSDTENFLFLEEFEIVKKERHILFPLQIPLVSDFFNKFLGRLPFIDRLGLVDLIVARPLKMRDDTDKSVSVIIPARNEEGNIEKAVEELPEFGSSQEIIFVEGHSTDGTKQKIKDVIEKYKDKKIKFLVQDGKGKYDAVKKGFEEAEGELLFILDADLTVPPKELPKFYRAINEDKGEFINGSRLYYPMGGEAMPKFNHFGNILFSKIFSYLLSQRITDTLCGTKVLRKKDYERIKKGRKFFGDFDPFGDFDLLLGATKLNLKIVDVPVHYKNRTYGDTKISGFRHGPILMRMALFAMRKLKFGR